MTAVGSAQKNIMIDHPNFFFSAAYRSLDKWV
jgi:hypothetical protein